MGIVHAQMEDGLLELCLDKPKGNVLDAQLMAALAEALRAHADEPALRMVLLRAQGAHFSFGASVEEHRAASAAEMLRGFHQLIRQVASYPVPVVALVQGKCLGGAFELALACHVVFATPDAQFACPEIQLGVFPPVLAAIGPRCLGGPLAERLLLTGQTLTVEAAERCGWLAGVVPDRDAVLAWYRQHLQGLSGHSLRQAVAAARHGLLLDLGAPLDALEARYLTHLLPSHDGNEGIEAFLQRRAPVWSHA